MSERHRPRILFYCQSLVGLGHLTSSLRVIAELIQHCDVDLVYGGKPPPTLPDTAGLRVLRLPEVLIHPDSGDLYDPVGGRELAEVWHERQDALRGFLRWPYRALIVEFYPFGRRRFKTEIRGLIQKLHDADPKAPVFSFVREILVPEPAETEQRIAAEVIERIHTVFVRGDPQVVEFGETFSRVDRIRERIFYTGYVAPPPPDRWPVRQRRILVSQGGGDVGRELLEAAIRVAPICADYQFLIATGSGVGETALAALRGQVRSENVAIVPFLADFPAWLQASALSISMGGDNTLLDLISTRTPALAFPYPGNSEQALRIAKLAAQGWVLPLAESDLAPERLNARMAQALAAPYPKTSIAMDGARVMSKRIREILDIS